MVQQSKTKKSSKESTGTSRKLQEPQKYSKNLQKLSKTLQKTPGTLQEPQEASRNPQGTSRNLHESPETSINFQEPFHQKNSKKQFLEALLARQGDDKLKKRLVKLHISGVFLILKTFGADFLKSQ